MKQINISRDKGMVTFSPANIDVTETVFFSNLDADSDPAKATFARRCWPEWPRPGGSPTVSGRSH